MTTRAAVNILGSTGAVIDITTLGVDTIATDHPGPGQYLIHGTLGMVPVPEGWGYVVNQADAAASVEISFADGVLAVGVTKDGEPSDLTHSITLHVSVDELPPQEIPEPPPAPIVDPLDEAQAEITRLRAVADYAIAPLQDAVDVDEATEQDLVVLKAWKKYRVALNRVPEQEGYPTVIEWPIVPA
jgi:hypothetical protein